VTLPLIERGRGLLRRGGEGSSGRIVLAAVAIFLVARLLSAAVLMIALPFQEPHVGSTETEHGYFQAIAHWDTGKYSQIATHGYPHTLPLQPNGKVAPSTWAFYPLAATTSRVLMEVTGLRFSIVSSTLSLVAGAVAAGLIALLLVRHLPRQAALAGVAIWAVSPASPILQTPYTESLAVALVAGFLLALGSERWWVACVCALALGFTRAVGAPLLAVVVVVAFLRWRSKRSLWPVALVAGVVALSAVLWPMAAGIWLGDPSGFAKAAEPWRPYGSVFPLDPWFSWVGRWDLLTTHRRLETVGGVVLGIGGLVGGAIAARCRTLSPELRVWAIAYPAYMILAQQPYLGFARYLVLDFPLAVVLLGLTDRSRRQARLGRPWVLLVLAAMFALQVWWITNVWLYDGSSSFIP